MLAHQLKNSGITTLVHSDLGRTTQTAHHIARSTGARLVPSHELRPWNLGHFTGKESQSVHPEIVKYATDHPNVPVPGGESFNDFRGRFFHGLRGALATDPSGLVGLVTHHRGERLLNAWDKAGQRPDLSIHLPTFFAKGEKPASADRKLIDLQALNGAHSLQGLISRPQDTGHGNIHPQAGALRS